ncbi:MAG TPA: hypothetical protein VFF67_09750 [Thermoplasmata archaeon]|nr:hypothetical protein [Thermoplasmata archaeon]
MISPTRRTAAVLLGGAAVIAVAALSAVGMSTPVPRFHSAGGTVHALGSLPLATSPSIAPASLSLGVDSAPRSICAGASTGCPAGTGLARVTLTATATTQSIVTWPDVQVVFVIEYTGLDGVYNPYDDKGDMNYQCPGDTSNTGMPCEESNGVPFFIVNAGAVANSIQAVNPHSHVTFGMVDYYATNDEWDLDGGSAYHVDVGSFLPATDFGQAVRSTFQAEVLSGGWTYGYYGFGDNFLHSSSITSLFGALSGEGLGWQNNTHHVIIWMGSTAPRDPNYSENYCVSPALAVHWGTNAGCYSQTCEPSYTFTSVTSPSCEGWTRSQDGTPGDNIAALAHSSVACRESIGGSCPIDTIDLLDTATDPLSKDWAVSSTVSGGGVDGSQVQLDVAHVLAAGCDMAAATGGSWNGPSWYTCPDGTQGSLQYVAHGPYNKPNTNNPTLLAAFRSASFGPFYQTEVAHGAGRPMFTFVPFGNIVVAPANELQATAACTRSLLIFPTCQGAPTLSTWAGRTVLGWNFSTDSTLNAMYVGDEWMASFNVVATGPPFATVPVDACTLATCFSSGSGPLDGQYYTQAYYIPSTNGSAIAPSFPVTTVTVQAMPSAIVAPSPPPAAPVPPAVPVPVAQPIPLLQPVAVGNQVGLGSVSVQGVVVGLMGASFIGLTNRNRPIAMAVAAKSGVFHSKFESSLKKDSESGPTWSRTE